MAGRPRRASDAEVLTAVGRVVSEVGPGGLTLAAVAAHCGVSAPALAQRFGSKHGLLVAFAARASATVDAAFTPGRSRPTSPLGHLRRGVRQLVTPIGTPKELANHLALLHLDLVDADLRVHAVAQHRTLRRQIELLLAAAVDAGELVARPPAGAVVTAYHGALVTWAVDGRGALAAWVVRAVDDVLAPYRPADRLTD